jgi:hypothetical protein
MMQTRRRFPDLIAQALDATNYLHIRAGDEHRFTWIWVVVSDGRVFVRPWNDKAGGWYREFLKARRGTIVVDNKEIPVRAVKVRGAKLIDGVDHGYASKYTTKANQKYVKGFATAKRKATTLELVP